jgi:MSHA biogenesis protein MshI
VTQQINLYDAALLRRRDWLAAGNVAAATLALLAAMVGWSLSARAQLSVLEAESQAIAPQLKTLREQTTALAAQLASLKPDARVEAELSSARGTLALRGEILAVLQKGIGGGATGFGEYLRALARQSVGGLWLTGFSVAEGGSGMEIRGRMTDPALLPEYIRKLNGEPAFQGRAFAALKVAVASAAPVAGNAPAAPVEPRSAPAYHEFVLAPEHAVARAEVRR